MKILLGRDYYDGVQSLGMDQSIQFIRSPGIMSRSEFFKQKGLSNAVMQTPLEELIQYSHLYFIELEGSIRKTKHWHKKHLPSEIIIVGVAGKVYVGFAVDHNIHFDSSSVNFEYVPDPIFFWSEDEINDFAKFNKIQISPTFSNLKIKDFYKYNGAEFASIRDYMIEHKISIFTLGVTCSGYTPQKHIESIYCVINGDNLKFAHFQKCLDAYTIYQELSTWNSGVLSGQDKYEATTITEKIKLKQHGFDKWSFKKKGINSK